MLISNASQLFEESITLPAHIDKLKHIYRIFQHLKGVPSRRAMSSLMPAWNTVPVTPKQKYVHEPAVGWNTGPPKMIQPRT